MRLPFVPPLVPMLSKAADALPTGDGWQFEPKWDGFRTLVFRDGDEVVLQSRDEKPMNRYFPELVAPLTATLPERCVVDGEIVIVGAGGLDFEALLLRIHPAASRVKLLAAEAPASFVVWDLLALGNEDLREVTLAVRRDRLEQVLADAPPPVHLSPATRDRTLAEDWFRRFEGAGLDGVMAKRLDAPYRAGERTMIKVTRAPPTAWSPASAGTRTAPARWSARSCSASTTRMVRCTTSASPRRSPTRPASSSSPTWRPSGRTRSRAIPGVTGPRRRKTRTQQGNACPARPAAGTAART